MNTAIEVRAPLKHLINAYRADVNKVETLQSLLQSDEMKRAVNIFESAIGRKNDRGRYNSGLLNVTKDEAVKSLDCDYWTQAFQNFGVSDLMSADARNKWNEDLRKQQVPPFTEEHVIPTLENLLANRGKLLAEKVDGVYRKLSPVHKTNDHNGFYKRMIFNCPEYVTTHITETLTDLIQVCAQLLGRQMTNKEAYEFAFYITRDQPKDGKWYWIAGNILKSRRYLKGTAHMHVHPDLAWQLNKLLADHGYNKHAIASKYSKRSAVTVKAPPLHDHYLQPDTIISLTKTTVRNNTIKRSVGGARYYNINNSELENVMLAIGAEADGDVYRFDYDPTDIIAAIIHDGAIPEYKSHQFYPTPNSVAEAVITAANIKAGHAVLEPSAGNGNLVRLAEVKGGNVTAVEIAPLRCDILKARTNADIHQADYLKWRNPHGYDRIIMNPPFTGGQAAAHIKRAAAMLNPNGKLVAVVPAGFNADIGIEYTLSEDIPNAFRDASISVRILETI